MSNKQLVRQVIHDPRPIDALVIKEDYQAMQPDEYPIAEVVLPDHLDMSISNGVLTISVALNDEVKKFTSCLFDRPFFDTMRYIDQFGASVKMLSARCGLYPSIFLQDMQSSLFKQVQADSQPFNMQEVVAENCFYAKNILTDVKRTVVLASEQYGDNELECKYIKVSGDEVFTDKHYVNGEIKLLVQIRTNKFYLCVKKTKYLPMHAVQETCFNDSSSVRKVAIAYNAKVRNSNK